MYYCGENMRQDIHILRWPFAFWINSQGPQGKQPPSRWGPSVLLCGSVVVLQFCYVGLWWSVGSWSSVIGHYGSWVMPCMVMVWKWSGDGCMKRVTTCRYVQMHVSVWKHVHVSYTYWQVLKTSVHCTDYRSRYKGDMTAFKILVRSYCHKWEKILEARDILIFIQMRLILM